MLYEFIASVAVVYLFLMVYFNKIHKKFEKNRPPLITGYIPFIGVALQFGKDPKAYQDHLRTIYGDVFTIYVMGQFITVIKSPHDVQKIYTQPKKFDFHAISHKHALNTFGLPRTITPDHAHDQHTLMVRNLQNLDLDYLTTRARDRLEEMLLTPKNKEWQQVNMHNWISYIIVSVTTRSMFGDNLPIDQIYKDYFPFDEQFQILASGLPPSLKKDAIEKRRKFARHFEQSNPNEDACDLIKLRHEGLTEHCQDVPLGMGHCMGVISWVAMTNTLNATFWCMYYLLQLPKDVTQLIVDEIKSELVFSEGSVLPEITHESLNKLEKLDSLFDEVLRFTFSTMSTRVVTQPIDYKSSSGKVYHFEQNDFLMLSNSHYDPDLFEEPNKFKWDRFLTMNKEPLKDGKPAKLGSFFMTFGGGVSKCPGRFFAKNEMKIFAIALLLAFDIDVVKDGKPSMDKSRWCFQTAPPLNGDVIIKYRLKK
ncbi:25/26-hydroxycholesterol 7-alpha-hydroxylase [Acrasis kona]|uniref:25/26-hydroxycholesterol 7-alpha-hydroxylase n=1 Tax=Acrasis kona TaxID=1008807 RepID=A0AAW2YXJ7_9EUKA